MKNWERKELIRSLRRQGLSYKEIRQGLPFYLAKSTVSDWCKDIELTDEQKTRLDKLFRDGNYRGRLLGPKATQERRRKEIEEIKQQAKKEISILTRNEFKLSGLMLYTFAA